MWHSNGMFHYMSKAEFVMLVTSKKKSRRVMYVYVLTHDVELEDLADLGVGGELALVVALVGGLGVAQAQGEVGPVQQRGELLLGILRTHLLGSSKLGAELVLLLLLLLLLPPHGGRHPGEQLEAPVRDQLHPAHVQEGGVRLAHPGDLVERKKIACAGSRQKKMPCSDLIFPFPPALTSKEKEKKNNVFVSPKPTQTRKAWRREKNNNRGFLPLLLHSSSSSSSSSSCGRRKDTD